MKNKEFEVEKGFLKEHDFKFISFDGNECILEAPVNDAALNPYNIVHGGLIYGLMDTCCGVHIKLATEKNAVTISGNVNYLKPCMGKNIRVVSKIIKTGKNVTFCSIECFNDKKEVVSTGLFTFNFI